MTEHADERAVVILERVVQDYVPDYPVYGTTICPPCGEMVYVGEESLKAIDAGAWPLCIECAKAIAEEHPDTFDDTHRVPDVDEAICAKCGMIHGA